MHIVGCENAPKCRTHNGLLTYLKTQSISPTTLNAMNKINRQTFIPKDMINSRKHAFYDTALSIGHDVTISQPSLVAKMLDYLNIAPMNNILELGTGSGYNAAIISKLVPYGHLITVERVKKLGKRAEKLFKKNKNISVIIGDAMSINYQHRFDRIIITAEFLTEKDIEIMTNKFAADFSICVYPFKNKLWRIIKSKNKIVDKQSLSNVRFVPVLKNIK